MEEIYLVFSKNDKNSLWGKICGNKFSHVYAIFKDQYNWINVDPHFNRLGVYIMNYDIDEHVPLIIGNDANVEVLEIKVKDSNDINYIPRLCILNCVSIIKYILGLKLFSITPNQLYNKLIYLSQQNEDILNKYNINSIKLL